MLHLLLLALGASSVASAGTLGDSLGYRRDVYYVVDAFVVKRVERGPGWREVRYAVFFEDPPGPERRWRERVVSSEWVVVDGTGRLLGAAQFHALSGHIANPAHRLPEGKRWLDGVQLAYDRRDVEDWARQREARSTARRGLTPSAADHVREQVLRELPPPEWSFVAPRSLD